MLIFGSPWHLPPAWGDIPTWITAIATFGLLVGAIVTAIYAIRAFRAQSQEVSDQAEMLRVQSEQLDGSGRSTRSRSGSSGSRRPNSASPSRSAGARR